MPEKVRCQSKAFLEWLEVPVGVQYAACSNYGTVKVTALEGGVQGGRKQSFLLCELCENELAALRQRLGTTAFLREARSEDVTTK